MNKKPGNTIAVRIAETLAERIVAGDLEPGVRLRQDHIAEEFGASHVPVREAFRRLEAQGLAVSEPRRGVRVASFSLEEVREVAEMRAALEALALRHAAPHMTPSILDAAEETAKRCDAADNVGVWEELNRAFHTLILEPSAMPRLLATIESLHAVSARFLLVAGRRSWKKRTDPDHQAIIDALRRGQTDLAVSILSRHVRRIEQSPVKTASGTRDAFAIGG